MDVTYNFTAGTRAVAEQVNTNFADVKSAVDPLETAVADIEAQLTSGLILPDGSVDFTRLQSYKTYTVSNATNATPIVVTAVAHSFLTGDKVQISGVGGNTAANGTFTITKIGADTFSLDDSVGNGTFDTNGTAIIVPVSAGNLVNKSYLDNNAGALKISALGTVSSNITLTTNTVTTADVSGEISITLPTTLVSGNENTVVFDFSTTSSSSPTINQDATTVSITAASNATPIVITATAHGFNTGDKVYITGVLGNTAANGTWVITRLTADTFSINGSIGNGTYTSGGTVRKANFKWSSLLGGKAPTAFSTNSAIRNVLIFRTHDGGTNWEAEYTTYGGVETTYTRPNISVAGTMGSTSFPLAVRTNMATQASFDVVKAYDGNTSTYMATNSGVTSGNIDTWVYPKIKAISIQYRNSSAGGYSPASGNIYGSNDDSTYVLIGTFTNTNNTANAVISLPITIGSQDFYNYYRINIVSSLGSVIHIDEITPIGVYIAT